jgi:PRC-barrel domain
VCRLTFRSWGRLSNEQAARHVVNDKSEKIGTLDEVISDKKQLNFAILQVGGFLGLGGRLVAVPYESLVIDDKGKKSRCRVRPRRR